MKRNSWHLVARPSLRLAASAFSLPAPAVAQKTELLVYTALETDQLKAYEEGVQQGVSRHRDQVGARFDRRDHREAARRKGEPAGRRRHGHVGVEPRAARRTRACCSRTRRKGLDTIAPQYRDPKNPPAWVGMDVWGAAICFNTVEAAKQGLPKPETWKDLTKPVYKGKIVMPNPASSGTGYLDVTALAADVGRGRRLEVHGRAAREHRAVHALGQQALPPGGRRRVPDRHLVRVPRRHDQEGAGAPIDIVFPTEGLGWDLEASGIMKNTKKLEAAQALMDWLATPGAMELYRQELRDRRDAGHGEAAATTFRPTTRSGW